MLGGKWKASPFPEPADLARTALKAAVSSVQPSWEQADEAGLSRLEYQKLLKKWETFEGPVHDEKHFAVIEEIDDGLYAVAEYENGEVSVKVLDEEEVDEKIIAKVEFKGIHRAGSGPGPNAKCPCGSGRKFKKCCGRRIG